VGKLDERFQVMLHQGDEVAVASAESIARGCSSTNGWKGSSPTALTQ
jgi:hypothetical protein